LRRIVRERAAAFAVETLRGRANGRGDWNRRIPPCRTRTDGTVRQPGRPAVVAARQRSKVEAKTVSAEYSAKLTTCGCTLFAFKPIGVAPSSAQLPKYAGPSGHEMPA